MPSFLSTSSANTGNASAGSFNCNKPASVVQDNMLVLCHVATAGVLADMGTPSGGAAWTLLDSSLWVNPNGGGVKLWWKIAGASEPASYGLTQNSGGRGSCSIVAVQDPGPGTPVVANSGASGSTTSLPTPSTTPNGSDDFEIRFACGQSNGLSTVSFTPPAGFDERTDVTSSLGTASQSAATRTLSSGGATGVHTFALSASLTNYLGFTVDIASTVTPKSLADAGSASDSLAATATGSLAQAGSASEQLTVTQTVPLADTATTAEALTASAAVPLAQAASATDTVSAGTPHPVADTATGADAFAANATVPLTQPGTAAEALTSTTTLSLTQTASAADTLAGGPLLSKALTETAAASDTILGRELRDIGRIHPPRRTWSAAKPTHAWTAGNPGRDWAAAAPRRRYSAGPPRTT